MPHPAGSTDRTPAPPRTSAARIAGLLLLGSAGVYLGTRSVTPRRASGPPPPSLAPHAAPGRRGVTPAPAAPRASSPPADASVRRLGTVDRGRLGGLVATGDGALALVGSQLLLLAPGLDPPRVVSTEVHAAPLRLRDQHVFFLEGGGEALRLGVFDLEARTLQRHPLPGVRDPTLLFVYQDRRTLILGTPAPRLYEVGVGPRGPIPQPAGCRGPVLVGPMARSRALLECGGELHLADFSTFMPFSRHLGPSPGPDRPAPGEGLVEPDRDLWPVRVVGADPEGAHLFELVPSTGRVARREQPGVAARIAGADLALLAVANPDGSRTVEVVGAGRSRTARVFAQGRLDPLAVHLGARDWVVWWEDPQLVVMDMARGRLAARLALEGEVAMVPGRYLGTALPVARALPGASALDWLVAGSQGAPRLVAGPRELGGIPVVGGSAPGAPGAVLLLDDGTLVQVAPS